MKDDAFGYHWDLKSYVTRAIIFGQRAFWRRMPSAVTDHRTVPVQYDLNEANDAIRDLLESSNPFLVARFGCVELDAVLRGYDIAARGNLVTKLLMMLCGKSGPFWWDNSIRGNMLRTTGVFPADDETLMKFSVRTLEDSRQIDILGTWNAREKMLWKKFFPTARATFLEGLEPFFAQQPWTKALAGKRVLVVHAFAKTIRYQYENYRSGLFQNPVMLPEFKLEVYKSVMSYLGMQTSYRDWFEALEKMKSDIAKMDFDVAIFGCGAYGLSLGAFVKRELKRKAIVLGGVSQLLFGIKGGRWDERPQYAKLYNQNWCRVEGDERPQNFRVFEGGAYW